MGSVGKIFLGFFSLVVFVFLVFFTFFSGTSVSPERFSYDSFPSGKFLIQKDGDIVVEKEISDSDSNTGSTFLERVNLLSEIYFEDGAEYQYSNNDKRLVVDIVKGEYLFNFKDPSYIYIVRGKGFSFQLKGIGKFSVSYPQQNDINIFSLDGIVEGSLMSLDTDETSSTLITLYPHQFFSYNPERFNSIKNADQIRIKQVFTLGYNDSSIINEFGDFSRKFYEKTKITNQEGFNLIAHLLQAREKKGLNKLRILSAQSTFYNIPGIGFIKKYFALFLNDTKKASYYKNLIYEKLIGLFGVDYTKSTAYIGEIEIDLQKLEALSQKDYLEMREVIESNIKLLSDVHSFELLEAKKSYFDLYSKIVSKKPLSLRYNSYFSSNTLYGAYDRGVVKEFYKGMSDFIVLFFEDLKISPDDEKILEIVQNDQDLKLQLDYFALFLENILVSNLGGSSDDLQDITKIMSKYIVLNSVLYGQGSETRRITGIYINLALLKNIANYILGTYFLPERENTILKRKSSSNLNSLIVNSLKSNFNDIQSFFNENKKYLDMDSTRNVEIVKEYEAIFDDYDEYFLALTDKDKYEFEYDPVNKRFRDLDLIGDRTFDQALSENKLKVYLQQFHGIDISGMKVQVEKDYYEVTSMYVDGQKFNFKLYPYNDYELTDIFINDEYKPESYKLDGIQADWEKLYQSTVQGEKERYDFKNFFITKFTTKVVGNVSVDYNLEDNSIVCQDTSKFVTATKIKILDKRKGEFVGVNDELEIAYDHLCIDEPLEEDDILKISIVDALYKTQIVSSNIKVPFYAIFSSNYILDDIQHEFESIQLKVYQNYAQSKDKFIFNGTPILIRGKINVLEFKQIMSEILQDYSSMYQAGNILYGRPLQVTNIELNYFIPMKRYVIKFDINGKSANVTIASGKILNFVYNGKSVGSNVDISAFDTMITNLQ